MAEPDRSTQRARKHADSPWQRRLRALRRNRMAMIGLVIILFWAVAAIIAPLTRSVDPCEQAIADRLNRLPPSIGSAPMNWAEMSSAGSSTGREFPCPSALW